MGGVFNFLGWSGEGEINVEPNGDKLISSAL